MIQNSCLFYAKKDSTQSVIMTSKITTLFILWLMWSGPISAATITINSAQLITPSESDGLCTLYEAIDAVNNNLPSGLVTGECAAGEAHPVVDVIEFDLSILPAIFNTATELTLVDSVHIKGPSQELVTLTGIGLNRVFKVFNLVTDATFIISDISFADSAIRLPFDDYGAAIWGQHIAGASLTIERVKFTGNNAERGGGAIGLFAGSNNTTLIKDSYFDGNFVYANNETVAGGGAIFIGGQQNVTIENSTFTNNTVTNLPGNNPLDDAAGGAILVRATGAGFVSTVDISHSTFTDNIADGVGGALAFGGPAFASESSEVQVKHSTIVSNQADFNNDQTGNDSGGGGIYSSSTSALNLFNSIVASNSDLSDTPAQNMTGSVISFGFNLIGFNQKVATAFPAGQPNVNDDWVGTVGQIIFPMLSNLGFNGGPTPTMSPLNNSLAIDNGKCNAATADQRHQHNSQTGLRTIDQAGTPNALTGCDIGAVELGSISNNPPPIATDDFFDLLEGETLVITPASGLLINDVGTDPLIITTAGDFDSSATDSQGWVELLADGSFMFQTADLDAFGTTSFSYTVSDLINQSDATVELNVMPVNDAPFFTASDTEIEAILGQFTTLTSWANDISAGPANEMDQSMVFSAQIITAPNGFFAGFPSINVSNGNLSFELASDTNGQAVVDVTLVDNGGQANGGQNSFTRTITLIASDLIFNHGFEN